MANPLPKRQPRPMTEAPQQTHWVHLGITLFVASQVIIPLSYYIGEGGHDERFAWRMFSPVRLAGCTVSATDHTSGSAEPIRLSRELHVVWINLLKRARTGVVEGAIDHLCSARATGGTEPDVRLKLECRTPHGVSLGICVNKADRNSDGVPDGYANAPSCRGEVPADCFARDCGELSINDCHRERCQMTLYDGSANLCAPGGPS